MRDNEEKQLNALIEAVSKSAKYRNVSSDFVRSIGLQELAKRPSFRATLKATRNKLHQVGGAYLDREFRYGVLLQEIRQAYQFGDQDGVRRVLKGIMNYHSSTRERLPILEQFYTTILGDLPPIHSVIDVACGFHPLAIPWMPLAEDVQYYAYDIYEDMVDFLNAAMELMGVEGYAQARDVLQSCPTHRVDVAFVLKAIPCLEQVDKLAGVRLLEGINADHLVVSFPARSLGGREKGMVGNYEARFWELVANRSWEIRRFEFATELVFVVSKR